MSDRSIREGCLLLLTLFACAIWMIVYAAGVVK